MRPDGTIAIDAAKNLELNAPNGDITMDAVRRQGERRRRDGGVVVPRVLTDVSSVDCGHGGRVSTQRASRS